MRFNRLGWCALVMLGSVLGPQLAQAQGVTVQGGVYYGQPGYQQQQPTYVQQQPAGYQQPGYQQQTYVQQQQPQAQYVEDLPRLRFAITGGAGLGGGQISTLFAEGTVQLGIQLNDLLAIYYRPRGQIGFLWSSVSLALYASLFNPILVDFTFGDVFQVGVGPSFDYMVYSVCNTIGGTTTCGDGSTWGFGGDARIAVSLPYYQGRQSVFVGMSRGGYTFELNGHLGGYGFDTGNAFFYGQVGIAGGWILY